LKEEQFKVLKTMSEATDRVDLNAFAQRVNLTPNEAIQQIQELAKEGFLQRIGGGYGMTEKGKAVLKAYAPVPQDMGFHFYTDLDQPTNLTAQTIEEFYRIIKHVSVDSLEFHLYRGDFENWVKEVCKDPKLANEIGEIKTAELKGEALRAEMFKVVGSKYGIE